ncbi:hypothetical protein Aeqsu_2298 [Aequorivita sublithincola DSM 14238]|uniref:KWG repeat protein n=1 Tax=Aequorivita sublithincola (strain DSM 14238 / LMG 21431 / ACAM 643 / 9-3) TaxID=746697 RepID=I3YXP0_AEQSU|nr:WG repeat-containing protein [Aequorivita sublithincola]AFL81758.1 hypothetical protein Aeqsu_2298 [Aequorivita sublithincola DSM 14238]
MKKTVLLNIILILFGLNLNAQSTKAYNLYRGFEFEKALDVLNLSSNLNSDDAFLKMKILNCLGKTKDAESLKIEFLNSNANQSSKNKVNSYFESIIEARKPIIIKDPVHLQLNGEKVELLSNSETIRRIKYQDGLTAYLNSQNSVIYKTTSKHVILPEFNNGFAFIGTDHFEFIIINTDGKIIYQSEYDLAKSSPRKFDNDIVVFYKLYSLPGATTKASFPIAINTKGEVVYDYKGGKMIKGYHNGYTAYGDLIFDKNVVEQVYAYLKVKGVLDKNGNEILNFQKLGLKDITIGEFTKDGIASIKREHHSSGKNYGLIDLKGNYEWFINDYKIVANYIEDDELGVIAKREDYKKTKFGYVDKKGNIITDLKFDEAQKFNSNDFNAVVEVGGKESYINRSGEYLSPIFFEKAYSFRSDKYSVVQFKGKRYFIDKNINPISLEKDAGYKTTNEEELPSLFKKWIGYSEFSSKYLIENILNYYGEDKDSDRETTSEILLKFFKENREVLRGRIEPKTSYCDGVQPNRDILKVLLANRYWDLIDAMIYYEGTEYHWNDYDIIKGKKETILDFIECLLNNNEYTGQFMSSAISKFELIKEDLKEYGAKYGKEL